MSTDNSGNEPLVDDPVGVVVFTATSVGFSAGFDKVSSVIEKTAKEAVDEVADQVRGPAGMAIDAMAVECLRLELDMMLFLASYIFWLTAGG